MIAAPRRTECISIRPHIHQNDKLPSVSLGSSASRSPIRVGIDGPKMSKSSIPTRRLRLSSADCVCASENARLTIACYTARACRHTNIAKGGEETRHSIQSACSGLVHCTLNIDPSYSPAIVLFPTPPFPLATITTLSTFGTPLFSGGPPRRGIVGGGFACRFGKPFEYIRHCDAFKVLCCLGRVLPEDFHELSILYWLSDGHSRN